MRQTRSLFRPCLVPAIALVGVCLPAGAQVTRADGSFYWSGIPAAGEQINNDGRNDTRLDFEVSVPRGICVRVATVNGNVYLAELSGEISASTVNGDVIVAFGSSPGVDLSLTGLNGTFLSDFDLSIGRRLRHGTTRARLGPGGQNVHLSTVNGELRLVRN